MFGVSILENPKKSSAAMSPNSSGHQRSLFRNSNEDRKKRDEITLREMDEVTSKYLQQMEENSVFFNGGRDAVNEVNGNGWQYTSWGKDKEKDHDDGGIVVPKFDSHEIELETTMGMGEFGVVLKVGTISLNPRLNQTDRYRRDTTDDSEGEGSIDHQDDNSKRIGGHRPLHKRSSTSIDAMRSQAIEHTRSYSDVVPQSLVQRTISSASNVPVLWLSPEHNYTRKNVETDRILREELAKQHTKRLSGSSSTASLSMSQALSIEPLADVSSSDIPSNSLLVIKQIRKDLYPKKRVEAAKDLAREAKLLARLQQLFFLEDNICPNSSSGYIYTNHNNHPNLITLRGIVSDPGSPSFGILLDRLHLTLAELTTSWGKRQMNFLQKLATSSKSKNKGIKWPISPDQFVENLFGKSGGWFHGEEDHNTTSSSESRNEQQACAGGKTGRTTRKASPEALLLLGERVLALWDVSEGMAHLHSHKILYRDLKTENVGRTVRGAHDDQPPRMQIFDFGLAKECKLSDRVVPTLSPKNKGDVSALGKEDHMNIDATNASTGSGFHDNYKMTGLTGTMRIMAPEVIRCQPYGLPADVYSFAICLWEVFAGIKCNFLTSAEICDKKDTVRPKIPRMLPDEDNQGGSVGMPPELQQLLEQCWHEDPSQRPGFPEISGRLLPVLIEVYKQQQQLKNRYRLHDLGSGHRSSNNSSSFWPSVGTKHSVLPLPPWRSCMNGAGGIWNKVYDNKPTTNELQLTRQQQQWQDSGAGPSSSPDQDGVWSRLETIYAFGLSTRAAAFENTTTTKK